MAYLQNGMQIFINCNKWWKEKTISAALGRRVIGGGLPGGGVPSYLRLYRDYTGMRQGTVQGLKVDSTSGGKGAKNEKNNDKNLANEMMEHGINAEASSKTIIEME